MVNPMLDRIYLDYAAATPLDPRVWTAMEPFFATHFANPSSLHQEGVFARRAVEEARAKVAALIKAQPDEIIFTSGPTESINLAIQGALAAAGKRGTILLSETEHAAGLAVPDDTVVNKVPVDDTGLLNEDIYAQFLAESPGIASFAWANNETGTILPIHDLAQQAKKKNVLFHTDATQAIGILDVSVERTPVDLLSFGSAKMYGPKGVGALFIRRGTSIAPLFKGGRQEHGLRPGTENVPAIVGFGAACEVAMQERNERADHLLSCKQSFIFEIEKSALPFRVNGAMETAPNVLNITFFNLDAEELLLRLDAAGVAASAAAACKSTSGRSHVLKAMGMPEDEIASTLRFSFGAPLSADDAARAGALTAEVALRMLKPKL